MANNEYFNSLPKSLTEEETSRYFQLARNGDENAKNKLKEHNLRLVAYIIHKNFQNVPSENPSVDMDDLMSTGTFGLMKAVETFDIEKGLKFATYATRCITNEVLMLLRKIKNQKTDISLNSSLNEDKEGNELTINDLIDTGEDIIESYEQKEIMTIVKKSLDILDPLERQVVELYYGFEGERLTHKQIGDKLGFSQSYISRIDARSRKKLAKHLASQDIAYLKPVSEENQRLKLMTVVERTKYYANTIIDENITIGELSKRTGFSTFSIKRAIKVTLPDIDFKLSETLEKVLKQQEQEENQKLLEQKERNKQLKLEKQLEKQRLREQYKNPYDCRSVEKSEKTMKQEKSIKTEKLLMKLPELSGYTEEQIRIAISQLPVEEREILLLRYPLEDGIKHTLAYIASQYNIKISSMNWKIKSILGHTVKLLKSPGLQTSSPIDIGNKNRKTIFELFPEYSEEEIMIAINSLSEKNIKFLELKYGLNGKQITRQKDIAEQMNIPTTCIGSKTRSIKEQLIKKLEKSPVKLQKTSPYENKIIKRNKSTTIFELFPEYTEEQVIAAIKTLRDVSKQIIEMRYGLNGYSITSTKEIAHQLGYKETVIATRISDVKKAIAKRLEKPVTELPLQRKKTYKESKQGIYLFFPDFTTEEVNEAINSLDERRKEIINLKFGLNGNEKTGVREISHRIGCKQSEVNMKVDYIIKVMTKQLNEKANTPQKQVKEMTEEPKNIAQETLPTPSLTGQSDETSGITLITNKFENPINTDFEKHRENIKMLISMLNNPNEQVILLLRLGYVRNQIFTEEQISKFLGIEETEIHNTIQKGLSNIAGISAITMTGVESAKQQITITKVTEKNV